MSQYPQQSSSVGFQALLPKLTMVGIILYLIGLIIRSISSMLLIGLRVTLASAMFLIAGILLLIVSAILFLRIKYLLSISKLSIDFFMQDMLLKIAVFIVPLYILFKGIGFFQGALVTGIGLVGASILLLIMIVLKYVIRMPMNTPTMALMNSIFIILVGVFFAIAGFSAAGSSSPSVLIMHSGILGIAAMLLGIGLLVGGLAPTAKTAKDLMSYLGLLLVTIALIVGGALYIKDGVGLITMGGPFMRVPGLVRAIGGLDLVSGIMGILAGILFFILAIMEFAKMLSSLSKAAPPPPATAPPPPPPPPPPE